MKIMGWLIIIFVSFCFIVIPLQAQKEKKQTTFSSLGENYKSKSVKNKQFNVKLLKIVKKIVKDGSYSNDASSEFRKTLIDYRKIFRHADVMAKLFHLFKIAIEGSNEDSRYFLDRLEEMNAIAEEQGEYLKELNQKAIEIEDNISGNEHDESDEFGPAALEVEVEVRDYSQVVENYEKILMPDSKVLTGNRRKINLIPGKIIIRSNLEAIAFKLKLKRQIARMNKLREKLENAWRDNTKKLKRFQHTFPGITKRMAVDAARIIK